IGVGVLGGDDGPSTGKFLNANDGAEIGMFTAPNYASLSFSNDGKLLATGSFRSMSTKKGTEVSGEVKIWDVKSLRAVHTLDNAIGPVAFSPKEGLLATGTKAGSVAIWKVADGK